MHAIDIAATEAKNKFGEVLRKTQLEAQHYIIRRDGIPVAALIPLQDYAWLVDAEMSVDVANSAKRTRAAASLREFLARSINACRMYLKSKSMRTLRPPAQPAFGLPPLQPLGAQRLGQDRPRLQQPHHRLARHRRRSRPPATPARRCRVGCLSR